MSLLRRAATLAALPLCLLGLGVASAGLAAEPATTAASATVAVAASATVPLLTATLSTPAGEPIPSVPALSVPALSEPGDTATTAADAPVARFASLEDAVAAQGQGTGNGVSDEIACLAGAIYFEAKGEPLSGQLAVANVILNRARSGRFPPDVCGVVTQRGQFSFVHDGHLPAIDGAARAYRTAAAVARVAVAQMWNSPAEGALFFHARRAGMGRGTQVASIGNHIFYR